MFDWIIFVAPNKFITSGMLAPKAISMLCFDFIAVSFTDEMNNIIIPTAISPYS